MTDAFGTYDNTAAPDIELDDSFWEVQANEPVIPEGEMVFYIEGYEPHWGANKPSFGYNLMLKPYQDMYGLPVDPKVAEAKPLKKYMFVANGDKTTRKMYAGSQSPYFQQFLASVGIVAGADGKFRYNPDMLRGALVKGTVEWTKVLSTRENPNTGQVPTAIDESDPYTYVRYARIKDNTEIRGVRDDNGQPRRINI